MRTSAEFFFPKIRASAGADFNKLFLMAKLSSKDKNFKFNLGFVGIFPEKWKILLFLGCFP